MNTHRATESRAGGIPGRVREVERGEGGFALAAVLVLLAVGGLLLPALLSLVATSLQLEEVHETSAEEFYAADAGIEDALWQIKAGELDTLFPDYDRYAFSDYDGTVYTYSDYPDTASAPALNDKEVDVSIKNVWIPQGIPAPSPSEAQQIIDDGILMVVGSVTDANTYTIRLTYNYLEVEDPDWEDLAVDEIGIWLPPGFSYVDDSSNLEADPFQDYYCVPTTEVYKSGQAVVWSYSPDMPFLDLPGVNPGGYPLVTSITFDFTSFGSRPPDAALAWVTTSGVSDVDYAWDADVRVFALESVALDTDYGTSTTVQAYTARGEIRRITAAIEGDYYATGNSLLTATGDENYRNRLYKESSATIPTDNSGSNGIPAQGIPEAAFLYWTGWIDWHDYEPTGESYIRYPSGDISRSGTWDKTTNMFSYVDEQGAHDSNSSYLRHGTTAGYVLFSFPAFDVAADEDIQNLTVTLVARDDSRGTNKMQPAIRVGGQDYLTTSTSTEVSSGYGTISYIYTTNPRTGQPWTVNQINGIGTNTLQGFGVRSADASPRIRLTQVYAEVHCSGTDLKYPDSPTPGNLTALIEDAARTNVILLEAGDSGPVEVRADGWQIEPTTGSPWEDTWSYCCYADVTDVVRQWIEDGDLGNNAGGTYTLGHKVALNEADPDFSRTLYVPGGPSDATGYPLGSPALSQATIYQYSHAGWSLVVIYTSPETQGHQLYLFDIQDPDFKFTEAWGGTGGTPNPDFDGDGEPGGRIAGFLVPDAIEGETIAAKMTVFVGEGDNGITGDRAQLNGHSLSNSASPANNVWNSRSPGMSVQGVDIDTFVVEWDDDILETGDTSADVDLPTQSDGFNLVYIILSFRSDVTSGGTISFLISG